MGVARIGREAPVEKYAQRRMRIYEPLTDFDLSDSLRSQFHTPWAEVQILFDGFQAGISMRRTQRRRGQAPIISAQVDDAMQSHSR